MPIGVELTGTVPADNTPANSRNRVPVRFIGVDGPRWFLRAMLGGRAAEPGRGSRFEQALRDVVVRRGNEPLPVREPVPLVLPQDVAALDGAAEEDSPEAEDE